MIAIDRGSRICSTGAAKYTTRLDTRQATDTPRTSVHMSRVDVAPPAVVEAEEEKDRQLYDDHDRQ